MGFYSLKCTCLQKYDICLKYNRMQAIRSESVAFYNNRGSLEVDRSLDFNPRELEKQWVDLDHVLDGTEVDVETYRNLCRTAIGLTTRILFLPVEHCVTRSIGSKDSYKPTSGYVQVTGRNFHGSFSLNSLDLLKHGLRGRGTDNDIYNYGNHASVRCHVNVDSRYYHTSFRQNACLVDSGSEYPTQVASPEFIQEWTDKVLKPLEFDIKSRAYTWTGDPKTDLNRPQRIV